MSERPILFSGPMVRAILEGRKSQTRRVVKDQPPEWARFPQPVGDAWEWTDRDVDADDLSHWPDYSKPMRCPYGRRGDRLWVRETWRALKRFNGSPIERDSWIVYEADAPHANDARPHPYGRMGKIRPSIFMPRWASRLTLEVTGVRVERLQDISQADAIAEGAPPSHPSIDAISREYGFEDFPRSWYGQTWESINGPGSWAANPWVWVVEFRRAA